MSIGKFRSFLYGLARLLGDVTAIKRGKIGERIGRRVTGRLFGRIMGAIFRRK